MTQSASPFLTPRLLLASTFPLILYRLSTGLKISTTFSSSKSVRKSWSGFYSPCLVTLIMTMPDSRTTLCITVSKEAHDTTMAATADKSVPYFPLAGGADDGWSKEDSATATCFCGVVQLAFPTQGPGLLSTFVCHCTDCRKITASMFASNFSVADTHLIHVRGRDNLTAYGQSRTIASGKMMTNYFCSTCGTLMYRVGEAFPGRSILRIGTVDDFHLHETKLKPMREIYTKDRVSWLSRVEGAQQTEAQSSG